MLTRELVTNLEFEAENERFASQSTAESRHLMLAAAYAARAAMFARAGDRAGMNFWAAEAAVQCARAAGAWYRYPHLADYVFALFKREASES
jgi:hypothetical protein